MLPLNAMTDFSFMKGFGSAEQWYARCQELGVEAFGLADLNSTWGHVPFTKVFKDVKLLLGVQVAVVPNLTKDKRHGIVTLIARNRDGLSLLYKAMTLAHQQTYYRPRLTWAQLSDLNGFVEVIVNECSLGDFVDFEKLGFGYVACSARPGAMRHAIMSGDFKVVATSSPAYPSIEHREAYELVRAVANGVKFGEDVDDGLHMLRRSEYETLLRPITVQDEWYRNAEQIASECSASVRQATNIKPRVDHTLQVLAETGARERGVDLSGDYGERLRHELGVISDKKFEDYFLFVADVVAWAKERMFVGPCRGSSGGSLLCYLLGITELDPLRHGTLFERFLDVGRTDWPDIDIDFPDNKRDLVFEYLREKYGEDHVARLGTISKFGGKSAINDAGRAYGVEYAATRDVARVVDTVDVPLPVMFDNMPEDVQPILDANPELRKAALIDGHPRHHGVHAAGVVVTNEPVTSFGVLDKDGTISLDMKTAEGINLLKLDALGLRTMSVIENCCEQVGYKTEELYELGFDGREHNYLDDYADDTNVVNVFDLFNKDQVTGIFQFEGTAVRQLMRQINVETFDDLAALMSLARPGPLVGGAAGNWVKRRAGEEDFSYSHPIMEKITAETLGTIIYQEQAMQIVRELGSFDDIGVNGFRRAVGKKDPEALQAYRQEFLDSAIEKYIDHHVATGDIELDDLVRLTSEETANALWDEMCEFGSYAFNKSHAVAYTMLSYICAYLKSVYPMEYSIAQLRNAASEDQGKALLRELIAEGYEVIPFDHKRSEDDWSIQDGKMVGGFTAVKGVGAKTAKTLMEKRDANPDGWLDDLTPAQNEKITKPFNTPWDDLNRRGKMYKHLYDDPDKHGIRGPILRLDQVPEEKGQYCFIATLTKRQLRTKTDDKGKAMASKATFLNLYWEDDSGDCGSTISRFKYEEMGAPIMEIPDAEGRDFLVRGTIINEGQNNWFFIDKLKELTDD